MGVEVVAEEGTCDLCGQEMVRTPDDCWHPYNVPVACPPEPGRMTANQANFDAWQEFYTAGLRPGRPGREHFRPLAHPPADETREGTVGQKVPQEPQNAPSEANRGSNGPEGVDGLEGAQNGAEGFGSTTTPEAAE